MRYTGRDSRGSGCEKGFSHQRGREKGFSHQQVPYQRISRQRCFQSVAMVLVLLAGCHENDSRTRTALADGEDLPILRQVAGTHSHETRAMQLVVRDPATMAQVPLAEIPVNFNDEMLLVVTLGRVTSDQYAVSIDRVWREGGRLRVAVNVQAPEKQTQVAMASPYCIAVVPRNDLNVADFTTEPPHRERSWEQSTPPEKWGPARRAEKPPRLNREKKH